MFDRDAEIAQAATDLAAYITAAAQLPLPEPELSTSFRLDGGDRRVRAIHIGSGTYLVALPDTES